MLARVDVLDRDLDAGVGVAHRVLGRRAVQAAAVGVAAPRLVDGGEVVVVAPVARVEQLQQPRPVGAGLGAEDPRGGAPPGRIGADLRGQPLGVGARVRGDVVVLVGLRRATATAATASSSSRTRCGKASRKKPEMRTVTSMRGRPSSASGHDLDARHALRLRVPRRPHAEQREDLGHVVALRAHRGGAPGDEADHPRQRAGLAPGGGRAARRRAAGRPPTTAPRAGRAGRRCRSCARSAARRCAPGSARPRAREAMWRAAQGAHDAGQLVGRPQDPRDDLVAGEAQRALDAGVGEPQDLRADLRRRARRPVAGGEAVEQRHVRVLEPVDEVARAGARPAEALHEAGRRPLDRRAARRHQRRLVEPERRADGAAQARHVARAEPQHGRDEPAQLIAPRRVAEHVQAVLDLDVLDLAQVAVDVLDELADVLGPLVDVEVGLQVGALDRRPDARGERRAAWTGRAPPGARTRRAAPPARPSRRRCRRASSAGRGGRRSWRARGAWPARPRRGR